METHIVNISVNAIPIPSLLRRKTTKIASQQNIELKPNKKPFTATLKAVQGFNFYLLSV